MPRVNPKTIDPIRIQEQLLGMPFDNPKPRYEDKNLPTKKLLKSMFAQDFTPGSGNVETDNQLVDYIQSTVRVQMKQTLTRSQETLKLRELVSWVMLS